MARATMSALRVTMADVARSAGVHVTTVSLAIRNHPRLPECTRRRIRQLAEDMGYRPDPLLRALVSYRGKVTRRRTTPTLAYVTNWKSRWGWKNVTAHPDFFSGAGKMAEQLGFKLEHFWMQEPGLTDGRLSRMLYSRAINGIIIASHGREMGDALQFDWQNFCGVKIDYFPHQPVLFNVTNNQCDIIRLAMQKAAHAGYSRIGFVMHRGWDHSVDHLWTAGFLCEQQHYPASDRVPAFIFPEPEPIDAWLNESVAPVAVEPLAFERWFNRHRPDVIISKGSFVLQQLKAMGLSIPRDVAFVDVFLENPDGTTAGVRQNHETVGAVAVEILAAQLQYNKFGIPEIPTTTFVEGTWFGGLTCPGKSRPARRASAPAVKRRA